jgi:undecaprenyl phosphate N,N'-diacetylbacillosamine 1-phosphate transferase
MTHINAIYEISKRLFDFLSAILLMIITIPIWFLVILFIKLDDRGPIFFTQIRVGRGGRPFKILKFRSMVQNAENKGLGLAVSRNDDRFTRIGKMIRAFSIDEIPQLINVLRGEMSLIGPRPTVPQQVDKYSDFQRRRLMVRPGLTGWAQVNGRNSISWEKRIELDVWYVDNRSLWLDLMIVFRTPLALLANGDSHYGPGGVTQDFGGKD